MGEGGGEDRQVGPPAQTATPDPRLKARPSRTERWMELYMRAGSTISPTVRCASLAKRPKREDGPPAAQKAPNPETALRQQIKAATEEPVKEALDAALKKVQGSKTSNAFCAGPKGAN